MNEETAAVTTTLEALGIRDLRDKAKEVGLPASWIIGASKAHLIEGITMGRVPKANEDTSLGEVMAEAIRGHLTPELRRLVKAEVEDRAALTIRVIPADDSRSPIDLGTQHYMFPKLLDLIRGGDPVWITGPAGSGKSTAAAAVAKAENMNYFVMNVGPDTRKSDLFGFLNAMGKMVDSLLRQAITSKSLFVMEEMDATHGGVTTCTNAILDRSEKVAFGNELISKHPDFRFIATANTVGMGANRVYIGRNQLDAATLDRFAYLEWPYDEQMERSLSPSGEWVDRVQKYRAIADEKGIRAVISPRASIQGGTFFKRYREGSLNGVWNIPAIENTYIFKGIGTDDVRLLRRAYDGEGQ